MPYTKVIHALQSCCGDNNNNDMTTRAHAVYGIKWVTIWDSTDPPQPKHQGVPTRLGCCSFLCVKSIFPAAISRYHEEHVVGI